MDNIRDKSCSTNILTLSIFYLYFDLTIFIFFFCFAIFNVLIALCNSISLFIGIPVVSIHFSYLIGVANSTVEYSAFKCD